MDKNLAQELAKEYVTKRRIPELFEALMTGLMVEKPEDHVEFLMESLKQYKDRKEAIKWDIFITKKGGLYNTLTPIIRSSELNLLPVVPSTSHSTKSDSTVHNEHQEKAKIDHKSTTFNPNVLKGKPILFISGGPGSGKGTQCEQIVAKYAFTHLSTGDLIRAAANDVTTEKGRFFNEVMSQGKLISSEDILGLLKDAICHKAHQANGFLIDGFPRRIDQGIQFENEIGPCDALIYFDLPDQIITERLIHRGQTSGRIDDNVETIRKRLVTFHNETTPILGYYGKQGKLITIDADRQVNDVFNDVSYELTRLIKQDQVVIPPKSDLNKLITGKIIFAVGGPGCDKNQQCEKIVEKYGYTHFSIGDLLRQVVEAKSDHSEQVKTFMKEGKLVPMDIILDLLKENLINKANQSEVILIDGFPRNVAQAKAFEDSIGQCELVIYIKSTRQAMTERLSHRCQTSHRLDDNEETIENRLKIFHNQTVSVLDFYENKNKPIVDIDLALPSEEKFNEVQQILDHLQ